MGVYSHIYIGIQTTAFLIAQQTRNQSSLYPIIDF